MPAAVSSLRVALGVCLALATAAPLSAQVRIDALAPGDTVRLRYAPMLQSPGAAVRSSSTLLRLDGQLLALTPDTLVLTTAERTTALPLAVVRDLDVRRGEERGSFGRGALWGGLIGSLVVGGFVSAVALTTTDGPGYGTDSNWIGAGFGAGLVLGAPIGGIINRFLRHPRWEEVALPEPAAAGL